MKNAIRLGVAAAIAALGINAGCGGHSDSLNPDGGIDPGAACEQTCLGKLVLDPSLTFLDISVDRNRQRVYGNGVRVDVSNSRAMKATPLPKTGAIVVDPSTGRYATTEFPGTGDDTHTLFIFNPDDTLYDSQPLPGLTFALDVDAATGRFFATTRDEDQIVVCREDSRELLASRSVGPQAMNPIYDPMSGNVFVNLAVGPSADYQWVILDRNDAIGPVSEGHVLGVDGLHNFVYVAVGNDRNRLEIRESATWALAGTQIDTVAYKVAPDTALNRLYVMRSASEVAVFDQASGAYLASLPLGDGFLINNIALAPGDDRIYVVGYEALSGFSVQSVLLVFATR